MIALMLTLELLTPTFHSQRALCLANAVQQAAVRQGLRVTPTTTYQGQSDLLLVWGPGAPDRMAVMAQHQASGRHAVAFDLAYWQRASKARITIDAAHPQAWLMRHEWPASRWQADRMPIADVWNPQGPVLVAGIGRKARVQYGDAVERWEAAMMRAATDRGYAVQYRRKQADAPLPSGVPVSSDAPIEQVLAGAGLVITWHSNVAVDAIRLGIPVICRDGAAAAVCPSAFGHDAPRPLEPSVRDRFLANLAWFQWAPHEAGPMLTWLDEVLA